MNAVKNPNLFPGATIQMPNGVHKNTSLNVKPFKKVWSN